jgi:hypothetical protein
MRNRDRVDVHFLRAGIDGGFLRHVSLALSSEPKQFPIKIGIGVAIGIGIEIGTTR